MLVRVLYIVVFNSSKTKVYRVQTYFGLVVGKKK